MKLALLWKFWKCFDISQWKRKKKVLCDNWRPDQASRQVDKPSGHNSFLPVLVKVALRQVTSAVLVADCNLHKSSAQSMWNTCFSHNYELSMCNTCCRMIKIRKSHKFHEFQLFICLFFLYLFNILILLLRGWILFTKVKRINTFPESLHRKLDIYN